MSDVMESIIAAIYIDSNLDKVKYFIENKILNNSNIKNVVDKHPKSLLQEYSLRYFKKIPVYTVEHNWNGYLEDRRPASNADPYKIVSHIVGTLTK